MDSNFLAYLVPSYRLPTTPSGLCFSFLILLQLLGHQVLHALAFRAGVVRAITFQQVDAAPHAEAGTDGDHQGLENRNSRAKEFHNLFVGTFDGDEIGSYSSHKTRISACSPNGPAFRFPLSLFFIGGVLVCAGRICGRCPRRIGSSHIFLLLKRKDRLVSRRSNG